MSILRQMLQMSHKSIYLFDSFSGFPEGETDEVHGKSIGSVKFANIEELVRDNIIGVLGSLDGVKLVPGFVEDTLPKFEVHPICLLRLDTDFYNSTKAELEVLYPHLSSGGVLIIDDYGMFAGSRRATDEYLKKIKKPPLLNRIDRCIWAGVKP